MTNGEYIRSQLTAFGVTDADIMITSQNIDPDGTLDITAAEKAMIPLLEQLVLRPCQKSISENGFSVSWDMSNIGWWYRYLCSKYGVKPNANVVNALGLSVIVDRTNKW